ncbi:hypothetical protein [Roseivirga sp.]|uniref:TRAFAC clade GTPase domain-containing protein n=1 Tax=Roseivirga sp. TaxID=1964215 RepID=UPI003B8E9F32
MEANNELLIIGPPKSGKTTFLAQLYGRLLSRKGKLTLAEVPGNIEGIKNAYKRLAAGKETEATASAENLEVSFSVLDEDKEFLLNCKDYGGEQVRDLVKLLEYDRTWIKRSKENDRWILFIRPTEIESHYDLSMKGFAEVEKKKGAKLISGSSDQSQFIELIQVLLHARGTGMKEPISNPCLLIALTCWDELNTTDTPKQVLQNRLPLFYQFIRSNWKEGKFQVTGVSAQEFPLKDHEENQNKYQDELPESFGYLVTDNNPKERDLTLLVHEVLNL